MPYYPINEEMARTAKHMNSFFEYIPGSATESYRGQVDIAIQLGEKKKMELGEEYFEQIDRLVDLYARKLAENINKGYEIETRCPSIMISGGSNFPVRKKEKQNAARDRNMQENIQIRGILDKIRELGTFKGGIRSDDQNAIEKLEKKLAELEKDQEIMKQINAYYRKNKTLDGCTIVSETMIHQIKSAMARSYRIDPKPYEAWALSNNNANIHRVRERIEALKKEEARKGSNQSEKEYEGFSVKENHELMRIQIIFDGKPDEDTRSMLKSYGFRWAPSEKAWQRMLNDNGRRAVEYAIKKLTEVKEE